MQINVNELTQEQIAKAVFFFLFAFLIINLVI